jgi:hypothetical protein
MVVCWQSTVVAVDAGCTVRLVRERCTLRSFQLAMVRAIPFSDGNNFFHKETKVLFVEEFTGVIALGEHPDLKFFLYLVQVVVPLVEVFDGLLVVLQGRWELKFGLDVHQPWERIFVHPLSEDSSLLGTQFLSSEQQSDGGVGQ